MLQGVFRGSMASDADAAVNEGDVMRVQVTVPQQTGFSTGLWFARVADCQGVYGSQHFHGWEKALPHEGSYWSWWTCDRDR